MKLPRKFKTQDSALSYYINQLTNLDRRLYEPLYSVTWSRDVKLRTGVTFASESTAFIRQQFAGAGTLQNSVGNMPWLNAETNNIPGVSVNGQFITYPLRLLGREVTYTSVELERSQTTGQSIDDQKMNALNALYQMNIDQMVYIGSPDVGATGLVNDSTVVTSTVPATGTGSSTLWINKTPAQILTDVNALLSANWAANGYTYAPTKLMIPPAQFGYLAATIVSTAGNASILSYLVQNSISTTQNNAPLEIVPSKWLVGAGAGGLDRMVAYTNVENLVRFPMVPIRRETPYYQGIRYIAPYIWGFGQVEIVYPETLRYADGI